MTGTANLAAAVAALEAGASELMEMVNRRGQRGDAAAAAIAAAHRRNVAPATGETNAQPANVSLHFVDAAEMSVLGTFYSLFCTKEL